MSTVVGEVSVKVPEPLPLKGVECVAKATGNAPRMVRRPTMLMIRNFMSSKRGLHCLKRFVRLIRADDEDRGEDRATGRISRGQRSRIHGSRSESMEELSPLSYACKSD